MLREVVKSLVYHNFRTSPTIVHCIFISRFAIGILLLDALVLLYFLSFVVGEDKCLDHLLELERKNLLGYVLLLRYHFSVGVLHGHNLLGLVDFAVLNAVI